MNGGTDNDRTMPGERVRGVAAGIRTGTVLLGRYEILSELGRGGMGVVWRCFDRVGNIEVALKALPPELSHNPFEMEEVRENFRLVEKLIHQNIAAYKTLERDEADGSYYLVMECVEGEDLEQLLKRETWGRCAGTWCASPCLPRSEGRP